MKLIKQLIFNLTIVFMLTGTTTAQFHIENINRGLVAIETDGSVYLSWRLLATDADSMAFNVYRGTTLLNEEPITASTNFVDADGTVSDTYTVVPVLGGIEQDASAEVTPWGQNYRNIPLQRPQGGQTPDGVNYTYSPNDASVGDLDGDGEYEIVLKWYPSNAKDNAQDGHTGNTYFDALEMDGTLLWRIDLGINMRAGAHYNPFLVYDLNGDGIAELVCRTASGTKDATGNFISSGPAESVDHAADYRNNVGRILSGPEFLTVFNGTDGTEMVTTAYDPARGSVGSWGDSYGNRVDRLTAAVLYLGGDNPSFVTCRGIYEKVEIAAWDLVNGELVKRWHFKSQEGYPNWAGMGSHNLSIADVDGDNKDEIIYGNCAIDDDGTGLWTLRSAIGKQTGDAMHVADIMPERPGLEKWGCHEGSGPGSSLVDAATGEVIWLTGNGDVGRSTAGDLVPDFFGMEVWGGTDGLRSAGNERVGSTPSSTNHVVWWDGDLGRELLDATNIQKYGNLTPILIADGCASNNGTKANPCLQADLFGDWREEVIWRTSDNNNLRIYTTTDVTEYRIKTLMHDPVYRLGVAWQNASYNQPPHTSFFLGYGMFTPDSLRPPAIPRNIGTTALNDTVLIAWGENSDMDLAGYRIYRGKTSDSLTLLSDVELATSFLDTSVINDSTYFYAVTAYDLDDNESRFSEIVQARPTYRPAAPTGLSFRFDTNSAWLTWDSQDLDYVSELNIYRSTSDEANFTLIDTQDKTAATFIDDNLTTGQSYLYAISVVDTSQVESFLTEPVSVTPSAAFTVQSEDATHNGTVFIDNNHLGFNGTAFANFESSNSEVEFTNIPGFGGGQRTILFRYALGNDPRTGSLVVNGEAQNLTMQGTGDWANWMLDSVVVTLEAGFENTIIFSATGSDYGNLDEITIVPRAITSVEQADEERGLPAEFALYQNYPNPFNPQTTIRYDLPEQGHVNLTIFNMLGERVETLLNEEKPAGAYQLTYDMRGLPSGIYFYRIRTSQFSQVKKMMLIR